MHCFSVLFFIDCSVNYLYYLVERLDTFGNFRSHVDPEHRGVARRQSKLVEESASRERNTIEIVVNTSSSLFDRFLIRLWRIVFPEKKKLNWKW